MQPSAEDLRESPRRKSRSRSRERKVRHKWEAPRYTIYVLRLTEGKWYIGRTIKPLKERLEEHRSGRLAAVWSRKYEFVRLVESMRSGSGVTQLSVTKQYMALYGIDNVRGSCYCRVELTSAEREKLELDIREIRAELDLCFNCGGRHYASQCKQTPSARQKDPAAMMLTSQCVFTLKDVLKLQRRQSPAKTPRQSTQDRSSSEARREREIKLADSTPDVSTFCL